MSNQLKLEGTFYSREQSRYSESIPYKAGRFVLTIIRFALTIMLCISFVFTLSIEPASAVCCHTDPGTDLCPDGTEGTPFCGIGPCDIFGCNCEGGCRTDPSGVATATASDCLSSKESIKEYFGSIDTDQLGSISLNEFNVWAGRAGKSFSGDKMASDEFAKIDTNNNGSIEPVEFDSGLGKPGFLTTISQKLIKS